MRIRKRQKGFSLIEVSVVILIIGIFVASVFVADKMISKFRLKTAEALTRSSPINGITQSALWLETSLESSFASSSLNTGDAIDSWNDQKNTTNKVLVTKVGTGPEYSNTINRIHAVKFNAAIPGNHLQIADASFLNNTNYTIIVLEKRQSSNADNYFFGDKDAPLTANQSLLLGYKLNGTVTHSQGTGASYDSTISAYAESTDKPRVFTFVQSSSAGKKTYINGVLAAQDPAATTSLSGMTSLAIGKGYTGEIGEIAIFTKALLNEERKSVEDYLGKKWTAKINRDVVAGGSCTSGTVTDTGCSMDCSTASINGVTSPSTVLDGQTGVTATCGATGYTGSITVNCPAGTGSIIKSGNCACNSGLGYSAVGDTCVPQCSFSGTSITGILTTTPSVGAGTGLTQNCNGANLNTANSITFDCVLGSITNVSGTCGCNTNYSLSGSVCQQQCSFTTNTITGILSSTPNANFGTGLTQACNGTNFKTTDSITFNCSGGVISVTAGSCTCDTGFMLSGSSCLPSCTFSAANARVGISTTTTVAMGTSTQSCNEGNNFNPADTLNYTCASGGAITINSGACDTCVSGYYYDAATTSCKQNLTCTGGTISTSAVAGRKIHTFNTSNSTATFACTAGPSTNDFRYLVVGIGGWGGFGYWGTTGGVYKKAGGGGGGGGVKIVAGATLSSGHSTTVTMGNFSTTGAQVSLSGSLSVVMGKGGLGADGPNSYTDTCSSGSGGYANEASGGGASGNCGGGSGNGNGQRGNVGSGSNPTLNGGSGGSLGTTGLTTDITGTNRTYGLGGSGGVGTSTGAGSAATVAGNGGNGGNGSGAAASGNNAGGNGGGGLVVFSYPFNP